MKHLLLILSLIASTGYSDSKTDTTIVPKKAGGSVIINGGTGKVLIKGATVNVRDSEAAGTTTLTSTDSREQIFNLSAARTVKLPSSGIAKGDKWTFKNVASGNFALTIQPSGASTTLAVVNSKYAVAEAVALINTPSAAADWLVSFNYEGQPYLCDFSGGPDDTAYNGGNKATIAIANGAQNIFLCTLYPYQSIDGSWSLKLNFHVQSLVYSSWITFNGWTTRTGRNSSGYQGAGGCTHTDGGPAKAWMVPSTNQLNIRKYDGADTLSYPYCSLDIMITSRPTWAY